MGVSDPKGRGRCLPRVRLGPSPTPGMPRTCCRPGCLRPGLGPCRTGSPGGTMPHGPACQGPWGSRLGRTRAAGAPRPSRAQLRTLVWRGG
eukprot:8597570-Pyramimonas_sp.AAC.1